MKKLVALILSTLSAFSLWACPACEAQQPRILKGITHGAGPGGNSDYVIIGIMLLIVLFTLYYSVKWLIRPGEKSQSHIKRLILTND